MGSPNLVLTTYSYEWETTYGQYPVIIHVSGDIYAIVYQGTDFDGFISTVNIAASGEITSTGYTVEFDIADCVYPSIVNVTGNLFAIAYRGVDGDGWIKTLTINIITGEITLTGNSLEFDIVKGSEPVIVHVIGTVYAVAYQGPDNDGWMKTVTIDGNGVITLTGNSLEFDAVYAEYIHFIHVTGDVFVVVYMDADSDGWMKTVTIDGNGVIAATGESLEFDATFAKWAFIIHISGTVYAIAYSGSVEEGLIKTCTISNTGVMALTGNSIQYNTRGVDSHLVHLENDWYIVTYEGPDNDGWMKTVEIGATGGLSTSGNNSLEFDGILGQVPCVVAVSNTLFAVVYHGSDSDGWAKTVRAVSPGGSASHIFGMMKLLLG